jgi:hypothetical protein
MGAVAFAQEDGGGADWPFDFRQRTKEATAVILGISVDDYTAAVDQAHEQVLGDAVAEGWLTQEQADTMKERRAGGPGRPGQGKGMLGMRAGKAFDRPDSPLAIAAEELGLSVQDLRAELHDGKTVADVAAEKGVDLETINDAYLAALVENLNTAVEDGKITQERADWTLEQAAERLPDLFEQTWEERMPGKFRGGKGPGRFEGFPGQSDS